jgi:hypothetical protein
VRREDWIALALLSGAYWAPVALIGVSGEFPLSDDWAYARAVESWIATGQFDVPAWAWAPAIPNILFGALFWKVLGASFESLRWSTLVAGHLGVLGAFALGRQLGVSALAAGTAALCLAWNPIHMSQSFTFMTDVMFTTLVTWSLVLMSRGWEGLDEGTSFRPTRLGWLAGGLALAVLASVSRNAGPLLLIAVILAAAIEWIRTPRALAWFAGVTAPLVVVSVAWLVSIRGVAGALPQVGWVLHERVMSQHALYALAVSFLTAIPLLGACAAPVLPFCLGRSGLLWKLATAAAGTAFIFALAWRLERVPPFGVNVLWDLGVGARTLPGWEVLPSAPVATGALTALGVYCGVLALIQLASRLTDELRKRRESRLCARASRLALLFVAAYPIALAFQIPFFDRWLLPVFPPFAALVLLSGLAAAPTPRRLAASALTLLTLLGLSTVGSHDMMASHRARWDLLRGLLAQGVEPERVHGGFEFNGYYKYQPGLPAELGPRAWIGDPYYVVSHAPAVPGYERVETRSYRRWLPPGVGTLSLHERLD